MSETQRPDAKTGVYFVWQIGAVVPSLTRSVLFGPRPEIRKNGDRPFVVAVHELTGELLERVKAASDNRQGAEEPHGNFPWADLEAAFPAPAA